MSYPVPTVDQSATELKRQVEVERLGAPFLVYRDPLDGQQAIVELRGRERLTIGRGEGIDVPIDADESVSRLHAELYPVGDAWVVADEGLSTNGTFVNGTRVVARRRLDDRDLLRVGGTGMLFRDPAAAPSPPVTRAASGTGATPPLGAMQRRVAVALCRPLADNHSYAAAPASNRVIAAELMISVSAVKAHLRALFEKFELGDLPQNRKRISLAEALLRSGSVNPIELSDNRPS